MRSFVEDLRAVLVPERKWHYVFHLLTILVASSYWLGSHIKLPEASWEEIAMYRPRGDNQVYPIIAALSQLNFGDPTDSLHHGEGTGGSQIIPLLPYALGYALFGAPGYMVADVVLSLIYFTGLVMLLRRCNFGNFSSLLLGTALSTRSLQILATKIGESFAALLSVTKLVGVWEWGFPDLFDLHIFVQRIPRPMGTEIFLLLLLYLFIQQWHERKFPTFRRGLAIGSLFVLLLQGDPFSVVALGLLFLWIMGWTLAANGWRWPWGFMGGGVLGAIAFGWYFVWQRFHEHHDIAVRFGMAPFPRDEILFLPGYGPLVRVGVVCALAVLLLLAARRARESQSKELMEPERRKKQSKGLRTAAAVAFTSVRKEASVEKSIATFCASLVVAGWFAQPVQLFLLGKGTQIYHYLIFVLPTLYSYAILILLFNFIKLAVAPEFREALRRFGQQPRWVGMFLFSMLLLMKALVGMENKIVTVSSTTNARQETNVPWAFTDTPYRDAFRALEKEFRNNPVLKEARSIATFCYEVNFLLTGFYDKTAYLPDNAYSTLSDEVLEDRLLETLKIVQLPPANLTHFIQANFVMNYWLGCAKYWMTSDYQYSTRDDYTEFQWSELEKQPPQSPWVLCLPISEFNRLAAKYESVRLRESDRSTHPDAIIIGLERNIGLIPDQRWYRGIYTNQMFSIFVKIDENTESTEGTQPSS